MKDFLFEGDENFEELIVIRLVSELIVYSDNVLLCNNRIVLL